jgi:uncharacterized membrane-anchored protein
MQSRHIPTINARYWTGITLASVFGTNMGDFYAHESGLGLLGGVPILVGLFLAVYAVEHWDRLSHEAYYWLCIIIMRTGATNIADYMAGRRGLNIDRITLSIGLGLLLAVLAWWAGRGRRAVIGTGARSGLQDTASLYWTTMLVAGVFGTVLGDLCEHQLGEGVAALLLIALLTLALIGYQRGLLKPLYTYWLTIATARTTGTAIGDWLAENKLMNLGLPLCTLLTGLAFVAVLVLWRGGQPAVMAPANSTE